MKKSILIIVWLFSFFSSFGQLNYVQDENVKPANFEEYLVQLAWTNSPEAEGGKYIIDAKRQEVEIAKKEWTRNLMAGLNFNDVSLPYYFGSSKIDTNRVSRIATYPLWQVGIGINFGDLITRKNKIKIAESNRKLSEADLNSKKQKIKAQVLTRYQEYLLSVEILKVRLQSLDAAESNKTQISNRFTINKASFQDYNEANKTYVDALEGKIKSETEVKVRKLALEELLGVKWESVEKLKATYDAKEPKK